jgi:mono/diheme cytochrome c family protein
MRGASALLLVLMIVAACSESVPASRIPALVKRTPDPAAAARGAYLAAAAGCAGCHTDKATGGARFAGGKAIPSRFGTLTSRNITPDPMHGIGAWSDEDFFAALRTGISPGGETYFPVFPFTSFTLMTDRDILDIRAYLATLPAAADEAHRPPSGVKFPLNLPHFMSLWRALYFDAGPLKPDPQQSAQWNRGAYLANAVAHCGECHTPRNWLAAREDDRRFGGGIAYGAGGKRAPNITPDPGDGIGKWRPEDVVTLLKTGMTPDGDFVAAPMSEVVEGTAKLGDSDRMAIAVYLKSLPPLRGKGG